MKLPQPIYCCSHLLFFSYSQKILILSLKLLNTLFDLRFLIADHITVASFVPLHFDHIGVISDCQVPLDALPASLQAPGQFFWV